MSEAATRKARADFSEIGATGLNRTGGYIQEEFLRDLVGRRARRAYKEMSTNDPVVGAILFAVDMLIRGVSWTVEPETANDRDDEEAAEFVDSCTRDMSMTWQDTVSEVLTMLPFGFAPLETVYKRREGESRDPTRNSRFDDGRIGWRKLPIRSPDTVDRWEFDEEGGVQALVQLPPPDYRTRIIPIEKLLLFRTRAHKGSPEGVSILRTAYRPWYFKKRIEEIEAIGIERDLAGLPVAWVPPEMLQGKTEDQRAALQAYKKLARDVKRDEQEGIVMPLAYNERGNKLFDFTLLSTGGRRQFDTNAIIARYDARIAVSVLADFILLGTRDVGSFALSSDKTELFSHALGAWVDGIAGVFNRHAIPRLLRLNGMRGSCRLVPGDVERVDLRELGEFIQRLAGAGAALFPDDELEAHLRERAGLPAPQREL